MVPWYSYVSYVYIHIQYIGACMLLHHVLVYYDMISYLHTVTQLLTVTACTYTYTYTLYLYLCCYKLQANS